MKRQFRIKFEGEAIIEIDQKIIDVVDDEWRKHLYNLTTPLDIAEHIGYNLVINNASLSRLDGWADQTDDLAKIIEEPEWDMDVKEITGQAVLST
ncbi:MAG: hypothetical protein M0R03_17195 [Novosphingobium sp.]|nr:hypothetical protein [Novosphingobium sp.]